MLGQKTKKKSTPLGPQDCFLGNSAVGPWVSQLSDQATKEGPEINGRLTSGELQ